MIIGYLSFKSIKETLHLYKKDTIETIRGAEFIGTQMLEKIGAKVSMINALV